MDRNYRRHHNRPISIATTVGTGRVLNHPRIVIAIILALQIAFTTLVLLPGLV